MFARTALLQQSACPSGGEAARSGRKAVTLVAEGEESQEEWLLESRPQGVRDVMRAKAGGEIFADVLLSRCPEKGSDGGDGAGNVAQPLR